MRDFHSILVPLDGSRTAARSLGCAAWLASRLGARLHILSATTRELPGPEELARLRVAAEYWPIVELHQAPAYPEEAIAAAAKQHDARIVVMTARGAGVEQPPPAEAKLPEVVGHVTRGVMERCAVPVLLLPPRYREVLPWERLLVPASGGAESDEALVFAVRLASALDLVVQAAHVAEAGGARDELAARARYSDAIHHEYPAQLHELVARALPALRPDECRRIQEVALGRGEVASELSRLAARERISALVVGWHGRWGGGHAQILSRLIGAVEVPLLLVKSGVRPRFRLKVGDELE